MTHQLKQWWAIALVALAMIASDRSSIAETVRATDTGTGVVNGVVVWRGKPMSGTRVLLSDYNKWAVTNQAGRFSFVGIPPFKKLRFSASLGELKHLQHTIEYGAGDWALTMEEGETKEIMLGDPVESIIYNTSSGAILDRREPPGGWIPRIVRVIDEVSREPIKGAAVINAPVMPNEWSGEMDQRLRIVRDDWAQGARTDDKGEVAINGNSNEEGLSILVLTDTHRWLLIGAGELKRYLKNGVITAELERRGGVRGVFKINGRPVVGGNVSVVNEEQYSDHQKYDRTVTGVTDKDGRFSILSYAAGRHTVSLSQRTGPRVIYSKRQFEIAPGAMVNYEVNIPTGPGCLYGRAVSVNGPVKGAQVTIQSVKRPEISYFLSTDQHGRILAEDMEEGPYRVNIRQADGNDLAWKVDVKGDTDREFAMGMRGVTCRFTWPEGPESMIRPRLKTATLTLVAEAEALTPDGADLPPVTRKVETRIEQDRFRFQGNFRGKYALEAMGMARYPPRGGEHGFLMRVPKPIELDNSTGDVDLGVITLPDEGYRRVLLSIRTEEGKPPKEFRLNLTEPDLTPWGNPRRFGATHETIKNAVFEWWVKRPGRQRIEIDAPGYVSIDEYIDVEREFERVFVLKPE